MPSEIIRGGVSVPTPEPDHLAVALKALLSEEDSLKRQLSHVQGVIAKLSLERDGISPDVHLANTPVRENEFKGMRAVEAAEVYLKARRPAKVDLLTIAKDVVAGGAFPGDRRGSVNNPLELAVWNIGISLKNTNSRFDFSPKEPFMKKGKPAWKIPNGVSHDKVMVWLSQKADTPKKRLYSKPRKK